MVKIKYKIIMVGMRNFQDTFETRKLSFICAFPICMTVPLSFNIFLVDFNQNL